MQCVGGDPLAAVQQPAQRPHPRIHDRAARLLESVARAHLIRDRADSADPGRDVGWLPEVAATKKSLEEPGRFVDVESRVFDRARPDGDVEAALALHPGQGPDGQPPPFSVVGRARSVSGHVVAPPRILGRRR